MVLRQLPPPTAPLSLPVTINNARTTPAKQVELTTDSSSVFSQSVELAHSAVSQQPTNGFAWSVLGNALLTMFFKNFGSMTTPQLQSSSNKQALSQTDNNISCNNKAMSGSTVTKTSTTTSSPSSCQVIMNRCLAAYSQAVKDRSTALEPSFHYNRGLAWHYRVTWKIVSINFTVFF
ncbi:unnamed protein product [Trichobilharzia regenti]|nr:unnamed protein product [Trichobilharzia regenti]